MTDKDYWFGAEDSSKDISEIMIVAMFFYFLFLFTDVWVFLLFGAAFNFLLICGLTRTKKLPHWSIARAWEVRQ
jgi:hypothetical protein